MIGRPAIAMAAAAALCALFALPAGVSASTLEEQLADFVRVRAAHADVAVRVPALPVSEQERSGLAARFSLDPRQSVEGRVPVRVSLARGEETVRSLVVAVDVRPTRVVLVAMRPIRAGARLDADSVVLREVEARRVPRDAIEDMAKLRGLRARRTIAAGSVVRASRLEAVTDVQRGQRVRLVLRSGGLRIETAGRASEDGNVGDWIEARNWSSRQTVFGRVGADGAIHVEP